MGGEVQALIRPILMLPTGLWGSGQHLVLIFYNEGQTHTAHKHKVSKKIKITSSFWILASIKKLVLTLFSDSMFNVSVCRVARFRSPSHIHSCKLYCNYWLLIKILLQYDLSSEVVGKQRNLGEKCLVLVLTHNTTWGFKSTTRKPFNLTCVRDTPFYH